MENAKGRILVVDDDIELRGLLQRYLGENGYEVRAVPDTKTMDRQLEREPFDAMVLDLMMPDEDGLSACRRLRAANETIPIIVLTAKGDPIDRIIGIEMGADDYLAKLELAPYCVGRGRMVRPRTREKQSALDRMSSRRTP